MQQIVRAPRGCRKSMTALRVCNGWYYWKLWREVVYIDRSEWNEFTEYPSSVKAFARRSLQSVKLACCGEAVLVAAYCVYCGVPPDFSASLEVFSRGLEVLVYLMLLSIYPFCHGFCRWRTVIFDDNFLLSHEQDTESVIPRHPGSADNVIILSSNEGLQHAVGDVWYRVCWQMPMPTQQEMLDALRRMDLAEAALPSSLVQSMWKNCIDTGRRVVTALRLTESTKKIKPKRYPITINDLQLVTDTWGEEYALSVWFWQLVLSDRFLENLRNGHPPSRELIWKVCMKLDLSGPAPYKTAGLSESRWVTFAALSKLFPDHPDAAAKAAKLMQSDSAPRRLALATMFAVTADQTDERERQMLKGLRRELPRRDCPTERNYHRYYRGDALVSVLATHLACVLNVWIASRPHGRPAYLPYQLDDSQCETVGELKEAILDHLKASGKPSASLITIYTRSSGPCEAQWVPHADDTPLRRTTSKDPYFYEFPEE